jgi:hypothetical protein
MKKVILILLVGIALLQAGCKKFSEFQTDPNKATKATPDLLLNSIEQSAFQSTDINNALICRQMINTDGVSLSQYYGWSRNSYNDYDNLLQVLKMEQAATALNKPEYVPIGKFFRAWYFLRLTQLFGDIPYSEALKGDDGNYAPVYDKQQDIYLSILNDLKAANDLITASTTPIQGDIVFNGNMQQWKKAINSLSLRVLMSLSVKEPNTPALDIKKRFADIVSNPAQYPILTGNVDNVKLTFYNLDANRYPYFNSNDIQTAEYMDETFIDLLKSLNDTRLFSFADKASKFADLPVTDFNAYGGANGSAPIATNRGRALAGTVSRINPRFYKDPINEPSIALGYAEVQFILAEGVVRGWITGTASDYYNKGIQASMLFYGIDQPTIDTYQAQTSVKLQGAANPIKNIITQKYIASFMNSGLQPFFENRRTAENGNPGYPVFDVSGAGILNGGKVPLRWMYPDSESRLNSKNLVDAISRQYPGGDNINGVMWLIKP